MADTCPASLPKLGDTCRSGRGKVGFKELLNPAGEAAACPLPPLVLSTWGYFAVEKPYTTVQGASLSRVQEQEGAAVCVCLREHFEKQVNASRRTRSARCLCGQER